jgi:AraC-like DNA-binding protein
MTGGFMLSSDHLTLHLVRLKTGEAWSQKRPGLSFLFSKGGAGKCLSQASTQAVSPGDVVILNGPETARVVCSNGELVFWSFSLSLEHLFPLFAGSEISLLQSVSEHLRSLKHYPASTAVAASCHRMIKDVSPKLNLDHRGQLLRVAVTVLTDEFEAASKRCNGFMRMEEHLVHVFEALTADEILHLPIDELAQRFGCSRRHLNRLFHQYFKLSVAALKMEMRLLKAVSLLRNPAVKIINVADACGFHHLGLFNTCFRKRFGTSPGEWRKNRHNIEGESEVFGPQAPECSLRTNGLCPWARNGMLDQFAQRANLFEVEEEDKKPQPSKKSKPIKPNQKPPAKNLKVISDGIASENGHLTFKVKSPRKPPTNGSN